MLILLLQPSTPRRVVLLVKINPAPKKGKHATLDRCVLSSNSTLEVWNCQPHTYTDNNITRVRNASVLYKVDTQTG